MVTIPVVIVLLSPSMVTDARPTVKSPTILALPSTYSAVFPTPPIVVVPDVPTIVAIPLVIFRPLLSIWIPCCAVIIPIASICFTS